MDIQSVVDEINKVIIEAGKLALKYYYSSVEVSKKKDESFVSNADVEVERLITGKLKELIPNAAFIGEEDSENLEANKKLHKAKEILEHQYIWAIDPIDGTRNYVLRYGSWTVSIGLLKKDENGVMPLLGSAYDPYRDKLYYSDSEKTYVVYSASTDERVVREIKHVTFKECDLNEQIFVAHIERLRKYGINNIKNIRIPGGMVEQLSSTGAGETMGGILYASIWDIAAGLAICRTAGVNVYNIHTKEHVKEFKLEDFIFNETKAWELKEEYLVASESAKQFLFNCMENIESV